MKILALLHGPVGSGSDTTVRRIAGHLGAAGHEVSLVPDPGDPAELALLAGARGVEALIGTHALFSGASLRGAGVPYVIAFGGTDLNEYPFDTASLDVMTRAVEEAAALVAFTDDFVRRCLGLWPQVGDKLHLIAQAVRTEPAPSFAIADEWDLPAGAQVFLLPSGLRPVKDPLLLIDCIRRWHAEDSRTLLVVAGHSYDRDFEELFHRRCGGSAAIRYVGTVPRAHLQAAMGQAVAVLNTSVSECCPNALLEAMHVGCPVLARDIPGNSCLVRHDVTGLLFHDPGDFRDQARRLVAEPGLRDRLRRGAQEHVRRAHRVADEGSSWNALLRRLAPTA